MPSSVYVIELERSAGRRRDPRIPWVYVGSSARSPEERFAQHLRGYKSSRLVKRFALRLRPDLYEDLGDLQGIEVGPSRRDRAGQGARGLRLHRPQRRHLVRAGRRRLAGVGPRAALTGGYTRGRRGRRARRVVVQAAVALQCAQLLRGELGFWVADYIDQLDPASLLWALRARRARRIEGADRFPARYSVVR